MCFPKFLLIFCGKTVLSKRLSHLIVVIFNSAHLHFVLWEVSVNLTDVFKILNYIHNGGRPIVTHHHGGRVPAVADPYCDVTNEASPSLGQKIATSVSSSFLTQIPVFCSGTQNRSESLTAIEKYARP